MTKERLVELEKLGFLFEVAKKKKRILGGDGVVDGVDGFGNILLLDDVDGGEVDNRSNSKTWKERYEELQTFKEIYGHVIVPQNHSSLGWWVNTQRKEYKKLKLGKKSLLTAERVLKLVDVEFCFDASGHKGGGSSSSALLAAAAATSSTMVQPPMLEQMQHQYLPQQHQPQHHHNLQHQHHSIAGCGGVHLNPSVQHMNPNIQHQLHQHQEHHQHQHHQHQHQQLGMGVDTGGIQGVSPSPPPDMTNRVDVGLI